MTWCKRLVGGLGALFLLSLAAYLLAPSLIVKYVEDRYPDVRSIDKVELEWGRLLFKKVIVEREGLLATLTRITVDFDQVLIEGGTVTVDLDSFKRPQSKGTGSSGRSIVVNGLHVTVSKEGFNGNFEDVSYKKGFACSSKGDLVYKGLKSSVHSACVMVHSKTVTTERLETTVPIPIQIPGLKDEEPLRLENLRASFEEKWLEAEVVELGDDMVRLETVRASLLPKTVQVTVRKLATSHPWLKKPGGGPAEVPDLVVEVPLGYLLKQEMSLPVTVTQGGKVTIKVTPSDWHLVGAEASCRAWWEAIPGKPFADLQLENISGTLGFEVRIRPKPKLKIHNTCKLDCSDPLIAQLKRGKFTYFAYDRDNVPFERESGPTTSNWVSIADLPVHVPDAFTLLEDPGFKRHRGYLKQALFNSLKSNLEQGRFVRGGSTITMQLAKNLWLQRFRTLDRKAREVILSRWLEGCLSKAQIMELYLNVIEFGPDLYGIGAAARHYFQKPASRLAMDEAFYLARILPRPKRAAPPDENLKRTRNFIRRLVGTGYLPDNVLSQIADPESVSGEGWEVND